MAGYISNRYPQELNVRIVAERSEGKKKYRNAAPLGPTAGTELVATHQSLRRYRGEPIDLRRARRRQQFIEAGLTVFGDTGFQQSSITEVCRVAKLARGQFYEHFGTREGLLLAVYDFVQDDARNAVTEAIAAIPVRDAAGRAHAAVHAYAQSVGADPRKARISHVEIVGVSAHVEQHRIEKRQQWVKLFQEELTAMFGPEYIPVGGFQIAAMGVIGALMAMVSQWSTAPSQSSLDDITAVLTRFLVGLID